MNSVELTFQAHLERLDRRVGLLESHESFAILRKIEKEIAHMARTLDETLEMVKGSKTRDESLIALFNGLKTQLADVLAGTNLAPAVQAKVDAIFDEAKLASDEVDVALNTDVPAPPVEPAG